MRDASSEGGGIGAGRESTRGFWPTGLSVPSPEEIDACNRRLARRGLCNRLATLREGKGGKGDRSGIDGVKHIGMMGVVDAREG